MIAHLRHWFTPHHSNNFRARALHTTGLLALTGLYLAFSLFVRLLDSTPLHILGFTSSVTVDEVISLTNNERIAAGLPPLKLNDTLSDAARRKAANMLEENYWSHTAPSGLSPWHWITQAGYHYTHAGENLAKDFGSTDRLIAAWMNSPTHKENIVSAKYDEIGVAVTPGTLQGQETVLVVQLFGSQSGGEVPVVAQVLSASPDYTPAPTPVSVPATVTPPEVVPAITQVAPPEPSLLPSPLPTPPPGGQASYNTFNVKKTAGLTVTALFMLILVLDLILAESRSLSRRVGKNWAHLMFINVILLLVTVAQAGNILEGGIHVN